MVMAMVMVVVMATMRLMMLLMLVMPVKMTMEGAGDDGGQIAVRTNTDWCATASVLATHPFVSNRRGAPKQQP